MLVKPLVRNRDFIFDREGRMVLTRGFHLRRGHCCGNGCIECPYDGIRGSRVLKRDLDLCILFVLLLDEVFSFLGGFMDRPQEKDALLALISTLTVAFVVLFVSISYFLNLRGDVARREAAVELQIQEMNRTSAQSQPSPLGHVAGYETTVDSDY